MKKISITHINNRHNDWLRATSFYQQEIEILKKRLTEIAGKNTNADMLPQVEHYENQFKVQADQLDRLNHDIEAYVATLAREASDSKAGYVEADLLKQHELLDERYQQEATIVNDLRHEFNRFATHWM
jgi:hypothetical protein